MSQQVAELSGFLLQLYRDAREQAPDVFQTGVLERLQKVVPFDFVAWGGGEAEERQVNEVVVLNQDQRVLTEWSAIGPWDGFCDLTLQRLNETWHFDDIPGYRESFAYNDHWRRFDVSHMMATIMHEPLVGYVSFVGMFHEDMARPFTEAERTLVQGLMPHLAEALRLNRELAVARAARPAEGAALVDSAGRILVSQGPFAELLQEEWGVVPGLKLPEPLIEAARQGSSWRGQAIQATFRPFRQDYLVHVKPASPLDALAPRAREVAELYGSGFSYKETARRLNIAPETVRKHLAQVYDQLGVRSKAALARLVQTRN